MSDMATKRSVLVVGSANMDMVVSTPRFPKPGETVLADEFGMYPGGKGANQAVACAKLGGEVVFLGKMGRDMFRDRLVESLESEGVELTDTLIDNTESTGIALITVDGEGQNEIVVVSGSNMRLTPNEIMAKQELFDRAGVVMLQLEIPIDTVVTAARLAKDRGACVILNPAPAIELPDELLRAVDFITPNESEAELIAGRNGPAGASPVEAARCLIDRGVGHVLLTIGSQGAMHVTARDAQSYPAYRVDVVDTTAAGDAFNGAFAYAISRGHDIEDAVPFANAVAACCVTRMGAQTSMPSLDDVERFRREQPVPVLHAEG